MITFETERLICRPWTMDDVESAFAIYGDAEVMEFISKTGPEPDLETQREKLATILERYKTYPEGHGFWAMEEKGTGRIVGSVMVKQLPGHEHIEVGWHLGRFAWGNGFATEAGRAAIQHTFDKLGLDYIVAVVDPRNHRSQAVARRLGMRHEGRITAYETELEFFRLDRPVA